MTTLSSLDVSLMLRRSKLEAENARLVRELADARDRIAFLEGLVGCAPGEQIAPLRRRRWWRLSRHGGHLSAAKEPANVAGNAAAQRG